jgi:transcriptional activator protein UGA3
MDFLIDLYDYLCSVAAITSDNVPRPFSKKFGLTTPGPSGIHPLFGIASDLYTILARINHLALSRDSFLNVSEASFTQETLQTEARAIELSLQSWSPPGGENDTPDTTESTAAAFAVQWATMLRLREVAPLTTDGEQNTTKGPVDYILSALSLIRSGSQNEARMLFPVFMAGVSSTTKASRLTLEFRISLMKTTIGFGNIASAHQTLDEVWRRANKGETYEWRFLMRQMAPGMVLF